MPKRKINFEETILRHFHGFTKEQYQELKSWFPYCELNAILIDVCRQTLELAAENAEIDMKKKSQYGKSRKWQKVKEEEVDLFVYEVQYSVNKQSILDTIKQIEQ